MQSCRDHSRDDDHVREPPGNIEQYVLLAVLTLTGPQAQRSLWTGTDLVKCLV